MRTDFYYNRENIRLIKSADHFKIVVNEFGAYVIRAYYPGQDPAFRNMLAFKKRGSAENHLKEFENIKNGTIVK